MARQERLQFPGACYHLMARGNAGGDVFYDDEDRRMFLHLLSSLAEEAGWQVHCWCLMSNHFHILLTTPEPNLSKFMQRFIGTYSQRFNRRHSRQGHVFQGRYKSLLVASDAYGIELHRYILRNPLEAGLVDSPLSYAWSSAQTYLLGSRRAWMNFALLDQQLRAYGPDKAAALNAFLSKEQRVPVALQGRIYGDEQALERLQAEVSLPEDLVRPSLESFRHPGMRPADQAARAVVEGKHRAAEAARYFDVHKSTVTRAVARLRRGVLSGDFSLSTEPF